MSMEIPGGDTVGPLQTLSPEPANHLMATAGKVGSFAMSLAGNMLGGGNPLGYSEAMAQFETLLQQQMQWQIALQTYSAESNILKNVHEISMTPIRNMKIG